MCSSFAYLLIYKNKYINTLETWDNPIFHTSKIACTQLTLLQIHKVGNTRDNKH